MIKKYLDFVKESCKYKYGCVMFDLSIDDWVGITNLIDREDIYNIEGDDTYGIQEKPHLTILYGLHECVRPKQVRSAFDSFSGEISIAIEGIDIFENEKFDVVKLNVVKEAGLQHLHDRLSELPNSDEYPDYRPHITIAYVKKGRGVKYSDAGYKMAINDLGRVCYSHPILGSSCFLI